MMRQKAEEEKQLEEGHRHERSENEARMLKEARLREGEELRDRYLVEQYRQQSAAKNEQKAAQEKADAASRHERAMREAEITRELREGIEAGQRNKQQDDVQRYREYSEAMRQKAEEERKLEEENRHERSLNVVATKKEIRDLENSDTDEKERMEQAIELSNYKRSLKEEQDKVEKENRHTVDVRQAELSKEERKRRDPHGRPPMPISRCTSANDDVSSVTVP